MLQSQGLSLEMIRRHWERKFMSAEYLRSMVFQGLDRIGHPETEAYYKAHPQDAQKLLAVGESRADAKMDGPTLAAWTMLGNLVMNLDEVKARGIPYAIATDVGASPTVSMFAEMGRFMQVHAGKSTAATAVESSGHKKPSSPVVIISRWPMMSVRTSGRPTRIASSTTYGMPS